MATKYNTFLLTPRYCFAITRPMKALLLSVNEAAARYSVRPNTIRVWIHEGKLTRHLVKGTVCVEADQIESLTARKCPVCLEPFRPASTRQRFCSTRCRQKAHREGLT